jgi:hypothetical protein
MLIEQLKKIMPDDTSDDDLKAKLEIINADAQQMVDTEVKGLKENKTKLLDQMSKLKTNQLPEGFDPDAYKEYSEHKDEFAKKEKELADKELEGKGQWEALKIQMVDSHSKTVSELTTGKDAEISGLKQALYKELIENASMKAIEKEDGNSLFLLPHMRGNIKTVKGEDGGYSVQVMDGEGNPRFADDATTPFSVPDLVAEMKANDMYAPAFPNANAGGLS